MARKLKNLTVGEVSLVDAGANQHAHVVLFKRAFTAAERQRMASKQQALPDGSFPIATVADLENAIHAIGRAKDPAQAKRHIISRAHALGAADKLPPGWTVAKRLAVAKADDFETSQANVETAEFASNMLDEFNEAIGALGVAMASILGDDTVTDKAAAIQESIDQFREHVQGVVPEGIENAMRGAALAAAGYTLTRQGTIQKGDPAMADTDAATVVKALEDTKAALAKALGEIAILKMSDKHTKYAADCNFSDAEKEKWAAKSPAERDDHMDKHPVADEMSKRLPAAVVKHLADMQAERETFAKAQADMAKQLADIKKREDLIVFRKQALDLGIGEAHGETLQKAYGGDRAAIDEMARLIKAATAQAQSAGLYREFGAGGGAAGGDDPYAQLTQKAAEIRKSQPGLTEAQAFAKAYEGNPSLAQAERSNNRPNAA